MSGPRTGSPTTLRYREARPSDAGAIGRLHADSWRHHYRGVYSDAYLDEEAHAERVGVWTVRLGTDDATWSTVVAEGDAGIVGFVHTRLDEDPAFGALLDNLHVTVGRKREGVGRSLMAESARFVCEQRPGSGLYLWVLGPNLAAQAFYRAQGGARVEERLGGPFPGGGTAPALRIAWGDPSVLRSARAS